MSADKSKAAMLADKLDAMRDVDFDGVFVPAAAELRRLSVSEHALLHALSVAVVALAGAAHDRPEFRRPYKVVSDAISRANEARNG